MGPDAGNMVAADGKREPEATPFSRFQGVRHFGSLDALRCLAIVGVVWQHAPGLPHDSVPFTNAGATGVALFFALSGFLITTLLLREENKTGKINLKNFYARRTLRIFPLYYAVLGLYTALVLVMEHNAAGELFLRNLPYYATYTNNWFVDLKVNEDGQRRVIFIFAWTLATEEQFYLVWPLLMAMCSRRLAVGTLVFTMLADLCLTAVFGTAEVPTNARERLLRIATSPSTEICLGVLGALLLHRRGSFDRTWGVLGQKWSSPTAAILSLAVVFWPEGVSVGWRIVQAVVLCVFVLSCVIREDHGLAMLLRSRVLARVGVVSYGMYLLHMLCINTVERVADHAQLHNDAVIFALSLAATYCAAEVSFRFFESPILRLKRRFGGAGDARSLSAKGETL